MAFTNVENHLISPHLLGASVDATSESYGPHDNDELFTDVNDCQNAESTLFSGASNFDGTNCNDGIEAVDEKSDQDSQSNLDNLVEIYTQELTSNYEKINCVPMTDQLHRLQTIIRDIKSTRSEFIFAADRLIRLVIEAGLDMLPITDDPVNTPGGYEFPGSAWTKSSCGVSIIRSGEAMENGLRDCCRSIRIGKILVQTDEETGKAQVYYSKFPPLVNKRIILLMYPILNYDSTVSEAVKVLEQHGVNTKQIILLTLFATPKGVQNLNSKYPNMTILTTEISSSIPGHFSTKYFGTS